jgi:hypothetical protein
MKIREIIKRFGEKLFNNIIILINNKILQDYDKVTHK